MLTHLTIKRFALKKIYKRLFILLLLLIIVVASYGQKAFTLSSSDLERRELSLSELLNVNTVTASSSVQKLVDAPATIVSIDANDIEKFGWRDLKDLLRTLPGMDISYNVHGEVQSLAIMRGVLGNNKILLLQDGKRQNPITGEKLIFGHNMPLFLYKRIEIVYGPASAIYGADAYAGVINLITKDGGDIDGLRTEFGYIDSKAVQGSIAFGQNFGEEVDVVLGARFLYGEDVKLHKDYTEYQMINEYEGDIKALEAKYPINNWNLLMKVKYKDLTLGFDWQKQLASNAYSTNPDQYAYVAQNLWGQDIRHLYLDYNILDIPEKIKWVASASLGDYEVNPASNLYTFTNRELTEAAPFYTYSYSAYALVKTQVNLTLGKKVNVIAGSSYTKVNSFPKTKNLITPFNSQDDLEDDLSSFKDFNGYVYGLIGLVDSIFVERNFFTVGHYLQGEWSPNKKTILTLGLRYDFNSIFGSTINPRIGLVVKPTKKLNLKLLGGSAFIAPSNSFRWENRADAFSLHVPNFNIKPEKLVNVELAVNWFTTDNLAFRFSLFRNTLNDAIRVHDAPAQEGNYPYYNPLLITSNPTVTTNANLGRIHTQGFEMDMTYRKKAFLGSLRYAYLAGDDNGNVLPKVSPHKLVLNASYTHERFSFATTLRYVSKIQTTDTNVEFGTIDRGGDGSFAYGGHFLTYASCVFRMTPKTNLTLSIDNIFNSKHYAASPYLERNWIMSRAPQPLRKIYFGVVVRY